LGADEGEGEADDIVTAEPSAQLCSLRRKPMEDVCKLLNGKGFKYRFGEPVPTGFTENRESIKPVKNRFEFEFQT
jgi:hypothetical protein